MNSANDDRNRLLSPHSHLPVDVIHVPKQTHDTSMVLNSLSVMESTDDHDLVDVFGH